MPNALVDFEGVSFLLDLDNRFPQDVALLKAMHAGEAYRGRMPEPETINVMKNVIKPGARVLDVGACIGIFTCLMASLVGPDGKVVAIEPDERNLVKLRRNVEINGFKNVDVIHGAIPKDPNMTHVELFPNEDSGESTLFPLEGAEYQESQMVPAYLPMPQNDDFEFVKIDAEGAEFFILRRLMKSFNPPAYILMELNEVALNAAGSSQGSVRRLMEQCSYATWLPHPLGILPRYVPSSTRIDTVIGSEGDTDRYKINGMVLFATVLDVSRDWREVSITEPLRNEKSST